MSQMNLKISQLIVSVSLDDTKYWENIAMKVVQCVRGMKWNLGLSYFIILFYK